MKIFFVLLLATFGGASDLEKLLVLPEFQEYDLEMLKEEAASTVPDLIRQNGYPCETHSVITSDGYILTLHRIPSGKRSKSSGKVLFLQHGILSSSVDWIITGETKGLAYIMADEGYDIWLGNARGNKYSRNHTVYHPDKNSEFWAFSWHQIGLIDLPTMIDYVLNTTGKDGLYYAGHSQGTTSFFVMTSSKPEYNKKIKVHVSLAPIAYMNHMTSPLMHIIAFWQKPLGALLSFIGINEFLPNNQFLSNVGSAFCNDHAITQILCTNSLFAICGYSYRELNATLLPVLMSHTPAGSSTKQFLHYAQEINSGHFREYDHGLLGNMNKYGRLTPPDYDLNKITSPVYLLYSKNDWLSAETDVKRLCDKLNNCKGKFLVSDGTFNHLDYMYGLRAPRIVYNHVISLMSRH